MKDPVMKDIEQFERLLASVPVPALREGAHREHLKEELLNPTELSQRKGEDSMNRAERAGMTGLMRTAAAVLIATLLLATGWAAEKVYEHLATKSYYIELEKQTFPGVKFPGRSSDSQFSTSTSTTGTTIPEDAPPGSAEKAKRHHEERKQLIAEKRYIFLDTLESPRGGQTQYVYQFTYADGEQSGMNFSMRLEDVSSWEDYLQKREEHIRQRNERISNALAKGKFRLLDVEPMMIHICQETGSNQELFVQHIRLSDGKEIAAVRRKPADPVEYQTSWEDHLQAVRQGERTLLDLYIVKDFSYEVTLEDGSTTIFDYGGSKPLKKPRD